MPYKAKRCADCPTMIRGNKTRCRPCYLALGVRTTISPEVYAALAERYPKVGHLEGSDLNDEGWALIMRDLTYAALPGTGKTRYLRVPYAELQAAALETYDVVLTAAARLRRERSGRATGLALALPPLVARSGLLVANH